MLSLYHKGGSMLRSNYLAVKVPSSWFLQTHSNFISIKTQPREDESMSKVSEIEEEKNSKLTVS